MVYEIKEFRNNEIWFGTSEGGIFILKDEGFSRLTTQDGLISNTVWSFWEDQNGRIWIATQQGLSIYENGSITNFTTEDGFKGERNSD